MKKRLTWISAVSVAVLMMLGLASCGPENAGKEPQTQGGDGSITLSIANQDALNAIQPGQKVDVKIKVSASGLSQGIQLALSKAGEGFQNSVSPAELPAAGGEATVSFQNEKEGTYTATLTATSGSKANANITITCVVTNNGATPDDGSSLSIFNEENDGEGGLSEDQVTTLDMGTITVPANVMNDSSIPMKERRVEKSCQVRGRGIKGESIQLSLENNTDNVFELVQTTLKPVSEKRTSTKGNIGVYAKLTKAGTYSATVVAKYGKSVKRLTVTCTIVEGAADEFTVPSSPAASKVTATYRGANLVNGTSVKVHCYIPHGKQYLIPVALKFPGAGYKATVEWTPKMPSGTEWCISGNCTAIAVEDDINSVSFDVDPNHDYSNPIDLQFHVNNTTLVPGFKSQAKFTFTKGTDSFSFTVDFDIK